jgi:hypothetical protein
MAGAICNNRSLALEARDETKSINLHIHHIEKEIRSTKEYLLLPETGLEAKTRAMEQAQNEQLATFQADTLKKHEKMQEQIRGLIEVTKRINQTPRQ